jgi:hypothetical protein
MKRLAALAVMLFALPGFADSDNVFVLDRIVNQQQIYVQLTPNGNPLVHSIGPGSSLNFDIENIFSSTFDLQTSVNLRLAGQTLADGPLEGLICPDPQPCSFAWGLATPSFSKPVQGTIVWTIAGKTETFNFRYTSNRVVTPEPTTWLLLGTGLAAIGWRTYRSSASRETTLNSGPC